MLFLVSVDVSESVTMSDPKFSVLYLVGTLTKRVCKFLIVISGLIPGCKIKDGTIAYKSLSHQARPDVLGTASICQKRCPD